MLAVKSMMYLSIEIPSDDGQVAGWDLTTNFGELSEERVPFCCGGATDRGISYDQREAYTVSLSGNVEGKNSFRLGSRANSVTAAGLPRSQHRRVKGDSHFACKFKMPRYGVDFDLKADIRRERHIISEKASVPLTTGSQSQKAAGFGVRIIRRVVTSSAANVP